MNERVRAYELYCGNFECSTRLAVPPKLFTVYDDEILDGEVWLCPTCRTPS